MDPQNTPTLHQRQYWAWELLRQATSGSVEALAGTLVDAQVDLNPHQVEAALFACQNPLAKGVILADEVGLGKTIEAGLVIAQRWAERRRRILIIVPANLRKQWYQELLDKFGLETLILEAKSYNARRSDGATNPFEADRPVICSYPFARGKERDVRKVPWDLVVLDEAHRLRNVYKPGNVIGRALMGALEHVPSKVLLTATPLQNSLLELYGLVSFIDDRVFGDLDSFRNQFGQAGKPHTMEALRSRIGALCKRTLRRDVQPFVPYTRRRALVQEFTPSDDERRLAAEVGDYLRRPQLEALPSGQRQLISMVLWKLLASSSHAIAGALDTMAQRLQKLAEHAPPRADLVDALDDDFEALDESAEEWPDAPPPEAPADAQAEKAQAVAAELAELRRFVSAARQIRQDAKGQALRQGLDRAFAELQRLGAARKAIIFTESRRTQDYLLSLLEPTPYGKGIVLFNGTNSDARAQAIYKAWLARHAGTDRVSGSKTADTRAALVEHFRESGTVMIATEAGAEGINLQFCSLVINYDLPWNPQRIEQRIGRCHRYGQKHDVVVLNFVDRSNEADRRVYELLEQKFKLFDGVFGASDEVLGAIGSGVDVERRIAGIYAECRTQDEIRSRFEQLQLDLAGDISEAMVRTRQMLLENFDDEVHDKVRVGAQRGKEVRSRHERLLMQLTLAELGDAAEPLGDDAFELLHLPPGAPTLPTGRYELPRRSGHAHVYRVQHPLAQWALQRARQRPLPAARLRFDYDSYRSQLATLKPLRGRGGWLTVRLLTVEALDEKEQHLVVAGVTDDGTALPEQDAEKLLRLPAEATALDLFDVAETPQAHALEQDAAARRSGLLRTARERQLRFFELEVQKLDGWADDLKFGLEQRIKDIDREIKDVRRSATVSPTLEEKLSWQKRQRDLEAERNRLRRELFERQDEVERQRAAAIEQLEGRLTQQVSEQLLFTVAWELV
jgi:superfamily II DNA or RNA helicase